MATRRFCDICDKALTPEDDKPFVRVFEYTTLNGLARDEFDDIKNKATANVLITNEQNHVLTDVCNDCKLKVVNEGQPTEKAVATLQSTPIPTPAVLSFEPSLPKEKPIF